ncbi:hypothetical protein [Singulisphaera sp. PoT]|uniref:hypothetical protein n=1 Tax=Singulisphaera sp. PoT TaxID=3411797 RepID=UPI003BF5F3A4
MDRQLTINLNLDRRKADQSSAQFQANQKRQIAELLNSTEISERVKSALIERENQRRVQSGVAAAEAERGIRSKSLTYAQIVEQAKSKLIEEQNARRVAAMTQALMTEDQRVARSLNDRQVNEQAKSKLVLQENQKRIEAAFRAMQSEEDRVGRTLTASEIAEKAKAAGIERTNRQRIAAATRAAMTEQELLTKTLSREEVVLAARNSIIQKANQKRIDQEIKAQDSSTKGWGKVTEATGLAAKAVGSFAVQMLGVDSLSSIVNLVVGAFDKARQSALAAGEFVKGYRESLLELAALKGLQGGTTKVLKEDLEQRAKTGQTQQEATDFGTAVMGSVESSVGTLIDRSEVKKLTEYSGKLQTTRHIDATSLGQLTGMIPSLVGRKVNAEEGFEKLQHIIDLFDPGNASHSSMTRQAIKLAPLITSKVYQSPEEAIGLMSAFTKSNPEGAAENVQQFTRATVGSLGRMKGANIEGLVEKQAEYLKRLGASDQMSPVEIGKLISQDFSVQENDAAAKGEKFNALTYLQKHGYQNQEDVMALMNFHGMNKDQTFTNTFERIENNPRNFQQAMGKLDETQRSDPLFVRRRADLEADQANVATGAGKVETMEAIRKAAFSRLKAEGKVSGEYDTDWKGAYKLGKANIGSFITGGGDDTLTLIDTKVHEMIEGEAKRLGIDTGRPKEQKLALRGETPLQQQAYVMNEDQLYGVAKQIQEKGGDVLAGRENIDKRTSDALDNAAVKLDKVADKMDKALERVKPPTPPPVQVRQREQVR